MTQKLNELTQALGPGARPNKYRIQFSIPNAIPKTADIRTFDTLAMSTSFPEKTIGMIESWNQGRKFVQPGDTEFTNTWTVTFYNTEEHNIRRQILEWMRSIDHFQDNMHSGVPIEIMTDMYVSQLDSAMNETVRYTLHYVWPQTMSNIELSDEETNKIEQFTVTFAVSEWTVGDGELDKPLQYNSATKNVIA